MDSFFFIASKLSRPFLSPTTWLVVIPIIAWCLSALTFKRWARFFWLFEFVLIVTIGFYPVGQWLAEPLERFSVLPDENAPAPDGIIVLGGAWLTEQSEYWHQWELNHAAERELAFIALARKYPDAKLVFTGGSGKLFSQDTKEASLAKQLYFDLGVDLSRVVFENESRNTFENGFLSQRLVLPMESERWWLVTSANHMPRSMGVFCGLGWQVTPYPVDHQYRQQSWLPKWNLTDHLWELERITQEWIGLVVYRITGKTQTFFPKDCS